MCPAGAIQREATKVVLPASEPHPEATQVVRPAVRNPDGADPGHPAGTAQEERRQSTRSWGGRASCWAALVPNARATRLPPPPRYPARIPAAGLGQQMVPGDAKASHTRTAARCSTPNWGARAMRPESTTWPRAGDRVRVVRGGIQLPASVDLLALVGTCMVNICSTWVGRGRLWGEVAASDVRMDSGQTSLRARDGRAADAHRRLAAGLK